MVPKTKAERRLHLNMRDIAAMIGVLSFVGGIATWANTEIIVPRVLEQTRTQTEKMLDKYDERNQREVNRLFERLFKRLDGLETEMHKGRTP